MEFTLKGIIMDILPEENISGKTKITTIISVGDKKYTTDVAIDFWGDKSDALAMMSVGDTVEASFAPRSRFAKDRWYTNLSGSSIKVLL